MKTFVEHRPLFVKDKQEVKVNIQILKILRATADTTDGCVDTASSGVPARNRFTLRAIVSLSFTNELMPPIRSTSCTSRSSA
jgi:hypothetical protein